MAELKEVLASLTTDEQLAVRAVEAAELRAHNKVHEFKNVVEAQLRSLQEQAQAKSAATAAHIRALAKKYELDIEAIGFDFESLHFTAKPKA